MSDNDLEVHETETVMGSEIDQYDSAEDMPVKVGWLPQANSTITATKRDIAEVNGATWGDPTEEGADGTVTSSEDGHRPHRKKSKKSKKSKKKKKKREEMVTAGIGTENGFGDPSDGMPVVEDARQSLVVPDDSFEDSSADYSDPSPMPWPNFHDNSDSEPETKQTLMVADNIFHSHSSVGVFTKGGMPTIADEDESDFVDAGAECRRVSVKMTGEVVSIPDHPKAKLMYYLYTVDRLVDLDDPTVDILTDFHNYAFLRETETDALLGLAMLLNPDELTGRVIFENRELCGAFHNQFYEADTTNSTLFSKAHFPEGGNRARALRIMAFKDEWLVENYTQPMQYYIPRISRLASGLPGREPFKPVEFSATRAGSATGGPRAGSITNVDGSSNRRKSSVESAASRSSKTNKITDTSRPKSAPRSRRSCLCVLV